MRRLLRSSLFLAEVPAALENELRKDYNDFERSGEQRQIIVYELHVVLNKTSNPVASLIREFKDR